MVVGLVILTLAVCIAIDAIRSRRAVARTEIQRATPPVPSATAILERYFHPGHSWVMLENPASATVGVDDIARSFIGAPDSIEVVPQGATVRQGEPLVKLRRGSRMLTLVAPLSGVLLETNSRLSDHPALLKESPYEKGWVARIAPANLALEIHNLLRGPLADRWREGVRAQLAAWFAPKMGLVLQDGGQLADNFSELLSDKEWEELAASLSLVERSEQSQIQTREGL
jgi:glycine cleavage system H protein